MKRANICLAAAIAIAAGMFAGCKTVENDIARFSVVSSKNVDISNLGNFKRSGQKIGTDKKRLNKITFFSDKQMSGNYVLENALDSALETVPGATVMVDAKLRYIIKKRPFSKLYGYVFEGTALIDPSLTDTAAMSDCEGDELFFVEEDGVQTQLTRQAYEELLASL